MRRILGACLVALIITTACSGGSDESAPTDSSTPATTDTSSTTTTRRSSTTTTSTTVAPTTTEAPQPVAPLTGIAIDDVSLLNRPALIVKIDNHSGAQPQSGLNQADIVIEELVEGISRFAVVFHSGDAAPFGEVGPIRSARTTDVDLVSMFGTPLFAWSGANRITGAAILNAGIVDVGANSHPRAYRRGRGRTPHNLFSNTADLFSFAEFGQTPPSQLFQYREPGDPEPASSIPAFALKLSFDAKRVQWNWDPASSSWHRSQGDGGIRDQFDFAGDRVSAANIVVMFTNYGTSPAAASSPEAITVGSGELWVLTDGVLIQGRWDRASRTDAPVLTDLEGNPIRLTPGRTWIELPKPGRGVFVAEGGDPGAVPFP